MPKITPRDRLQIMFGCGNDEATTPGNGSGTPGLYSAWNLKWLEPIGKLGKPTRWKITELGRSALTDQQTELPEQSFIAAMAAFTARSFGAMPLAEAVHLANTAYGEFLADNKIKHGDPAYDWTDDAAAILVREYIDL